MPGVDPPPLVITLITSTRRATRSTTAARTDWSSDTTPPMKWQWPPGVVIGGPAATTVGSSRLPICWRSRRFTAA